MTIIEYQKFVWDIINPDIANHPTNNQIYLTSKLVNEILELYEVLINIDNLDREKIIDEAGDVLWYIANLCNIYHLDLGNIVARHTYNVDEAGVDNLLISSNMLLGRVMKNIFHGKELSQEEINVMVINVTYRFIDWCTLRQIKLSEIISFNHQKLQKRHGKNYNKGFYCKAN